ncbi:hypothetical protein [Actinokineospora sp.]|uniref:hypothetical protein n=1 Tax=Actinokineospora sp. TaxID=1872133 RepID=UPI003D6C275C
MNGNRTHLLTTAGLVVLPIICCALPVLIATGALAAAGSALGDPWVIGAAAVALLVLVAYRVRGRQPTSADDSACCQPEPAADDPDSSSEPKEN